MSTLDDCGPSHPKRYSHFRDYAAAWLDQREAQGFRCRPAYEGILRRYLLPVFGDQPLAAIQPRHVRSFVRTLDQKIRIGGGGAPRTVIGIYRVLAVILRTAEAEEMIGRSPCILARGDLPRARDLDPTRKTWAVYPREDAAALCFDPRVPLMMRAFYSLAFSTGMRLGEMAAVRWMDLDRTAEPLARLHVRRSWRNQTRTMTKTKTGIDREAPVLEALDALLAEVWAAEWERVFGRAPTAEDLIIPRVGDQGLIKPLDHKRQGEIVRRDCSVLGIRYRTIHAMRSTFLTLAQEDGAKPDVLERVTHASCKGSGGPMVTLYTRFSWSAVCREVGKLDLSIKRSGT